MLDTGRGLALWVFDAGLACCAVECAAALAGLPGGATAGAAAAAPVNVLLVAGTVTDKLAPLVLRAYAGLPEPRFVVSFGACSNSGGPYWDSYCVTKGADQFLPVNVYVPGCPPRPEALLHGLDLLAAQATGAAVAGRRRDGAAGMTGAEMTGAEMAALVLAELGPAGPEPGTGAAGRDGAGSRLAGGAPEGARCEAGPRTVTITVPAPQWRPALTLVRDRLGGDFFDWLTAVDDEQAGLAVVVHVYSLAGRHHVFLRTMLNGPSPRLPSATGIYRGADWHERETWEMFGVAFDGHPGLAALLLPDGFEGHPLRKDFALAARAARDWPGAPEPGERTGPAGGRRRVRAPGVPEGWAPP